MSAEVAAPLAASEEMEALCSELLLPSPGAVGAAGAVGSPTATVGVAPLPVSQELVLAEASLPGEGAAAEGSNVEIFIEAVAGNVTLSNTANGTEVLVKVVELYFCERCGQSFQEASLLSQHECLLLPPPEHLRLPGVLPAPTSKGQNEPGGSEPPVASVPEGSALECLLCPICQEAFAQPGELKEHFKTHRGPQGTLPCPEKGCCFVTEDRKQLRSHLRLLHGTSPVSCTYRACPLLFPSRPAMEQHHRTHFPFHCGHCDFVTANAKLFWQHRKSHVAETSVMSSIPSSASLKQLCILPSEEQKKAENCHPDWEATSEETGPANPSGIGEGSLEELKVSAGEEDSESDEDNSLEEDGESPCEGEAQENRKEAADKAKVTWAQHFRGDVAEGSEYIYKTHMCPECKRCFKKRTHLVEHLHLHYPDPSLQCPNCHKYFTSKSKLKIHMMRETGEKAHRCPLCHYSSVEKNALNRHMASMHEDISNFYSDVYSCPVCKEKFRLSQALKEHLKSHKAEPKRLSCFQGGCDYCVEDRKEFVRHLKDAHGIKAVECKYHACSLLFGTAEAMEAHRKTHYAFHCQQCDFICSNKHVFRKHKKQGHPGSEQLQCSFCPYATFNPVEYHDHVGKMHANEKIHKCTECAFATAHKRVLIRHMLLHTGEKPHKCELCDFTCRDVSYLSKHMLTHSNDKNFMCTECGYITKWKHYLNVHMRKHTGDLRYQCNQCSYRCHRADQLSSHKLRHQGKSLICEVCGFACKRKYELQKHMQAKHSQNYQVPIFQCQYCAYQTKYKQALLNHENCKHTKQKEFRCALCSYCTFSNTSLFFHKRKIHGYVPGDKDWLENYASKELEISSSESVFGYELGAALRVDASSLFSSKEQWAKVKPSQPESQGEEGCQQASMVPLLGQDAAPPEGSSKVQTAVGKGEQSCMADDSMQSDTAAGPAELIASEDVAESCMLHLETVNVSSDPILEHLTGDACMAQPESMEMLSCKQPPAAYEMLGSHDDLGLEDNDNALKDIPDYKKEGADVRKDEMLRLEDSAAAGASQVNDTAGEAIGHLERSCSDHSKLDAGPEMRETSQGEPPEAWLSVLKTAEQSHPPVPGDAATSSDDTRSNSESVLKALRKQDKEQAETLVLEGRVQMLVVQSESQIFKCEKCSYITRKEKSMSLHSKASCQSHRTPLVCRECGASFKQQRGLNTHLLKKCPVLLKKNKVFKPPVVEAAGSHCPTEQLGDNGAEIAESDRGGMEEPGHPESPWEAEMMPDKMQESDGLFAGEHVSGCPSPEKSLSDDGAEMAEEPSQQGDGAEASRTEGPLQVEKPSEKYRLEGGKLHCNACSFVCSRVSTITSHVEDGCRSLEQFWCSLCPEAFRSQRALKNHCAEKHLLHPEEDRPHSTQLPGGHTASAEMGQPGDPVLDAAPPKAALPKQRRFSCPTCPFTCHQERAMKTHKKRGCVTLGEFRCASCPFTSKVAKALRLHRKLHRKHYSKRPQLQCRQCEFTCKQARCLRQHVRIKHEGVKPHKCLYCEFSTTRRYRLEAHQSLHTGVGRIACGICSQTFGTNSKLRIHRLRVHEKTPTHFCPLCDYSSYLQNDITRHVNSCHRGELNFGCSRCEARFSSETALKQHVLRRHEQKVSYGCPQCGFVCHSEATLKCHVQKQHPHLECGTCKESFPSRDALEEHKKQHFSHRCELCSFAAKERQQLVRHYVESHEPAAPQDKPLQCPFCDFACRHQLVFDQHMKGHGGTRIYKCSDCEYTTKNRQKITWHIRIHTGEKPYKCHLCKYTCADPSRLKYHMRIHKEERKYLCPDCGYKCKWVNQLKYHMTKHTGLKPYRCDECEYRTNRADALRVHKETRHRDARSFICEQCGKAFKTRFLLKTHLKKHSEEKPYVCNACGRAFRWAAGLRHHYLTHTNEHPFFCRYCPYKAKQKFQVIKHIQRHHPECGAGDPSQGVGKDPSTPTVHLHAVQKESPATGPPVPQQEGECLTEKDGISQ
ncbi:zinc finger protein 142 isoform X1 [Tympanuchus pallidicinctus]|uniref:zinc finger protein 142 isoform X1 n=1 Tax=Tympanuchus pallidicinctus TaxID=109042 RepID=UPI0022875447|nr:zinc finger protein 142 isoform X1 [Tympanuchus pallidicinctus]XP_052532220.1 zinc finger protein 142 isoform X1 [Tympanuchus pallidicinctus]